jgi:hypothetical protein
VASILRPDGSIRTGAGVSGSFSARGYRLVLGPDGAPRLVRQRSASDTTARTAGDQTTAARKPGDANWDDRFGEPGVQNGISASAVNAIAVHGTDVFVGGVFSFAGGAPHSLVLRWDGHAWHALSGGLRGAPQDESPEVDALAVSGNTLFVGGIFNQAVNGSTPVTVNDVAAFDTQTNTWSPLGTGVSDGGCGDFCFVRVEAFAVSGSTLYAAGSFGRAGSTNVNSIARWNGSSWSALGRGLYTCADCPDIPGDVHALQLIGSTLYAGGSFDSAGTVDAANIARWNTSSSQWSALGGGISNGFFQSEVDALASDGSNLYVGGDFTGAGTIDVNSLARWNGSSWSAVDGAHSGVTKSGEEGVVGALHVSGTTLFVGGSFDHLQPGAKVTKGGLASFNLSSPAWTVLPIAQLPSTVNVFADDPAGGQYVGGSFDTGGPIQSALLVDDIGVLRGSTWSTLGQGVTNGENGRGFGLVVAHGGGSEYVGGSFDQTGPVLTRGISRWDGSAWHGMGSGVAGGSTVAGPMVYAITVYKSQVFIGGDFSSVSGVAARNIAVFSAGHWHAVGGGTDGIVQAFGVSGGFLYAGGSFDKAGGKPVGAPAARWKLGTALTRTAGWSKLGPVFGAGGITAIAFDGKWVFMGGDLLDCVPNSPCDHGGTQHGKRPCETVSGYDINGLIMWNTSTPGTWYYPFGCGVTVGSGAGAAPGNVETLLRVGTTLYVGGFFDHAGILHMSPNQVAANNVASLGVAVLKSTKTRWKPLKSGAGHDTAGDSVASLAAAGGKVYVAGDFPTAGGLAARGIAQWNPQSSTWSTMGSALGCPEGCGVPPYASGVDAAPNGIYVAGNFGTAGLTGSDNIARWAPPA